MKKLQTNQGFTLIEILIASYIFLLVIVAGTMIFTSAVGAKMKASAFWETQQEARYAMEKIVKMIRDEEVKGFRICDDFAHEVPSGIQLYLCKTGNCDNLYQQPRIWLYSSLDAIYAEDDSGLFRLTSPNVKVTNLQFDGYWSTSISDRQPYITIEMEVENASGERVVEKDTLKLRTTVSLRTYKYKYYDY